MNHLKNEKAQYIAELAEASFNFDQAKEAGVAYDSDDFIERILAPASKPRQALLDELDTLSQAEAVELVALMYVGRGDYIDDQNDKGQVMHAFQTQVDDFSSREAEQLTHICAEKDLVLHRYLKEGLKLLA